MAAAEGGRLFGKKGSRKQEVEGSRFAPKARNRINGKLFERDKPGRDGQKVGQFEGQIC